MLDNWCTLETNTIFYVSYILIKMFFKEAKLFWGTDENKNV